MKNVSLMELQHTTINRLLTDTCHVVRIIAIKVCIQNAEHPSPLLYANISFPIPACTGSL
jgi:hypothetical protein